jgi:DNA modification methylase
LNNGTTACKWDVVIPFEPLWKEYKRVIKNRGCIALFGSEPFSSYLRMSNIKDYKYDWILKKSHATGHLISYKRPMTKHELVSIFNAKNYYPIITDKEKKNIRPFAKTYSTIYHNQNEVRNQEEIRKIPRDKTLPNTILEMNSPQSNFHPSEKPVSLLEYLIRTYTLENETILDNCMGSGSTGVACINTNRNFIGIEKDPDYFKIAEKRIDEAIADKAGRLF